MRAATSAASRGANELTGLFASGLMDEQGILVKELLLDQTGGPLGVIRAFGFRSAKRVALWLEVQVREADAPSWKLERAVLRASALEEPRAISVWPLTPLPLGKSILVIELEAGRGELLGAYTLDLHEAGGSRTVTVERVRFP